MIRNDGLCWIHLPVDMTDPVLSDNATTIINQLHQSLGKPLVTAGQRNPYFDFIVQIGISLGGGVDRSSSLAAIGPVLNLTRVNLSLVDLVIAVGGEVEGLPVFFELTVDPATIDCPFSTATPKESWAVWGTSGASHVPVPIGNKWYRPSSVGASGALMKASLWSTLSRANVRSLAEYQAIVKANGPTLP